MPKQRKFADLRRRMPVVIGLIIGFLMINTQPIALTICLVIAGIRMLYELAVVSAEAGPAKSWQAEPWSILFVLVIIGGLVSMGYSRFVYGYWLVLMVTATVACVDMFAYTGGQALGKHRLPIGFSKVSPNKSIEGALIGFAAGAAAFFLCWQLTDTGLSLGQAAVLCPAVLLAAFFGDLLESKVKRLLGVDNLGSLLPGHGGLCDRLDAHVLAWLTTTVALFVLSLS